MPGFVDDCSTRRRLEISPGLVHFPSRRRGPILSVNGETTAESQVGSPALSDVPVAADYDGDGRTDVAVRRPSTGEWFIFGSATQTLRIVTWGSDALGDVPMTLPFALR